MIRFELSKKASDKIRKIATRILEVQEERCPVVKTQLKLAMNDPQFSGLAARCRNTQAAYAERDAAWEELMALLPSKRLDFDSMRQDALSYYGDDSDEVEHGMVFEVVRETYDLMTRCLYHGVDFDTESYNITDIGPFGRCLSDGFHHFYCNVVFGEMEAGLSWGMMLEEPLSVDKTSYVHLYDQFERFEFGWWQIYGDKKKLYFDVYNEGTRNSKQKMRKCAVEQKMPKKPQPFYGEYVRRCAELMLENPTLRQKAFREMAVAQDAFETGDESLNGEIATTLYKRLSTLHEPVLAMIPELNDTDTILINTVARMRGDYLFYLLMDLVYLKSAGMSLLDEANRAMAEQHPQEPVPPTAFETLAVGYLSGDKGEMPEKNARALNEMMDFIEEAGLMKWNKYGQLEPTPMEMTPRLLQALLKHGYGAYVMALMGRYKYEIIYEPFDLMETLNAFLAELDEPLRY